MVAVERKVAEQLQLKQNESRVVATMLVLMGAFVVDTRRLFTYKSGAVGPIYLDNRLIMSRPVFWERITQILARRIRDDIGIENVDMLNCVATRGLIHGSRVAVKLGLPLCWVDHDGSLPHVEGAVLQPRQRVVIIEDHLTSGGSVLSDIDVLRREGVLVEWCLSVSTYDPERVKDRLRAEEVSFMPICDLDSLLAASLKATRIAQEDFLSVKEWVRDPEGWLANHKG